MSVDCVQFKPEDGAAAPLAALKQHAQNNRQDFIKFISSS